MMDDVDLIVISSDEEICGSSSSKEENPFNCATVERNREKPNCDIKQQDNKYISGIPYNVSLHLKVELNQPVPDQCPSKNLNCLEREFSPISEQALLKESTSVTQVDLIGDNPNNDEVSDEKNMSDFYKKFLAKTLSMEHKVEDQVKLKKKLTKYHSLADEEYVKSSEFQNLIEKCLKKIEKEPLSLYFVVKEVLDCLLSKRVIFYTRKEYKDSKEECSNSKFKGASQNEEIYFEADSKNYKIVKKLTAVLQKLEKRIKELEEMEVDLSDEEDSAYVKLQRYRERFCKVYEKLCTYTSQSSSAKRLCSYKKIDFTGLRDPRLNEALQQWLNKTKQFPDFFDVQKYLKELNVSLSLGLTKEGLKIMATDVFMEIGNTLQRRRKYDLWDSFSPFLESNIDPATIDPELRLSLEKNFEIGVKKERELINFYAEKQEKDNINPQEVPDEEANLSPVESGDDDEREIEEVENTLYSHTETENLEESDEDNNGEENNPPEGNIQGSAEKENMNTRDSASDTVEDDEAVGTESTNNNELETAKEPIGDKNVENSDFKEVDIKTRTGLPGIDSWSVMTEIHSFRESIPITSTNSRKISDNSKTNNQSFPQKNLLVSHEDISVKKRKLEEMTVNNGSDSEVVIISSDDDECDYNQKNSSKRKVHHVNYVFINSNFNHIAFSRGDSLWYKRNFYHCNVKSKKKHRTLTYRLPITDITNIKSITGKFKRIQEENTNKWTMKIDITGRARRNFKRKKIFFLSESSVHCALESDKGSKNINSTNNGDQSSERGEVEQTSGDETMDSSTGGGLGGGNGQDNNDNNDNKKPFDHEKELEENQENDDQDEGENGEEVNERSKSENQEEGKEVPMNENSENTNNTCTIEEGEKEDITFKINKERGNDLLPVEDAQEKNIDHLGGRKKDNFTALEQTSETLNEKHNKESMVRNVPDRKEDEKAIEICKEKCEEGDVTFAKPNDEEEENEKSKSERIDEGAFKRESEDGDKRNENSQMDRVDADDAGDVPFIISEKLNAKTENIQNSKMPSKPRSHENRPSPRTNKASPGKAIRPTLGVHRRQRQVSYENYDTFSIAPGNWENFKAVKRRLYRGIPSGCSARMTFNNCTSQASPSKAPKSDEEIVKNFLQHSPSSISITRTKKAATQNKPSSSVLQALETLSRLKGISTTIVKGTSKKKTDEDVTVIKETLSTRGNNFLKINNSTGSFSNVQSDDFTVPKIVTVQGNVSGFENMKSDLANKPDSYHSKPYNLHRSPQDSSGSLVRCTPPRNSAAGFYNGNAQSCPRPRGASAGIRPRLTSPVRQQKNVEYVELD